jgi:hypothetical protein
VGGAGAQHAFFLAVAAGAVDRDRRVELSEQKFAKTTPRKVGLWRKSATRAGFDVASSLLSVIKGIEPRDQLEAMLAAQMTTVHIANHDLRA